MHWEERFRELAERQEGVLGVDQLADLDAGGDQWRIAKRSARWKALTRRVIRLVGAPESDGMRAHAALLDAGGRAVLHGESALAWAGLRGFTLEEFQVVRRRGTTTGYCELATVHRVRDLTDMDVYYPRGVASVTPLRAIWSEASCYSNPQAFERGVRRIGRLLDDAHRLGLVGWHALHESLDRLGRRGRAGTAIMRAASAARQPGSSPTESRNEDRFEEILATRQIDPLLRQRVVGGTTLIGRVDFRDPHLAAIVEVNSLAFHSTPSDRESDERRYAECVATGFSVAVVWEDALWSHPESVAATVREVRKRARSGDHAVVHTVGCPWPYDPQRIVVGTRPRRYRG